jgi:predicted permease
VAEQGFEDISNNRIDLWISLSALDVGGANSPGGMVVGRLAEGTSSAQALAELEVLSGQFRDSQRLPASGLMLTDTRPISTGQPGAIRQFELVFSGLGLIFLLTCANVGSLLLARALARQREAALRLSLGASRWRVARQSLAETLVLALGAGVLGVALAAAWPAVLRMMSGNTLLRQNYLAPDWSVVAFAIAASSVAAGVAGFSAARRIARIHPLQVSAQRYGPDRESRKARSILLAAQVTVTAVFLTSAGLLGRAVAVTAGSDPGFAVDGISLVSVEFREPLLPAQRDAFTRALGAVVSEARRDDVAFAAFRPLIKGASTVIRVHRPTDESSFARYITHRPVSANYFSLMRIPIVEGRAPMAGTEGREVVVNEMLARTLWPGESIVGKTLKKLETNDSVDIAVVGVARDVPIRALGQFDPVIYSVSSSLPLALVSTTTPEPMELLRRASRALEPSAFLVATPLRQIVRESASEVETASVVGWLVGAAALVISTLGIFGVFSYAVEERRREIGIRIALGGRASHVRLEVLRSGQLAAALGTGIGFAVCAVVGSLLRHQLYGLQPFHAFTYIEVAAILSAAVVMALWIPAWRATRVDPAVTLRCD